MLVKINKNSIPISAVIAGLLIVGAFVYINWGKIGKGISGSSPSQQTAEKAIKFINENILSGDAIASLVNVSEETNVYKIRLKIGNQEYDSYITRDGKFLFPEGYNLEATTTQATTTQETQNHTAP